MHQVIDVEEAQDVSLFSPCLLQADGCERMQEGCFAHM